MSSWRAARLLRRHESAYATAHRVASPFLKPKVKDWSGLLGYVMMTQPKDQPELLLAYWQNRTEYDRNARDFTAATGEVVFEGLLRAPSESLLARAGRFVSYSTVLLTLIAILGALQSLGVYGDWLLLSPTLHVKTQRPTLQYVAGMPIAETIQIANRTGLAHRNVAIKNARLESKEGRRAVALEAPGSTFELLFANTTESVQVYGLTPRKPGTYMLRFDLAAAAGRWRSHPDKQFEKEVEVWSARPVVSAPRRVKTSKKLAEFVSEVSVGLPAENGLECKCMIFRHSGVEEISIDYPKQQDDTKETRRNMAEDAEVAITEWHAPKTDAFRRIPFRIMVLGTEMDRLFESNMEVTCRAR